MQEWKKKKALMKGVKYSTVFEPIEREVLGDLAASVSEAIIARVQSAPKDELADMMGMASGHKEAPEDPSLARLFPDFQREGDEEFEGDAQLLRSLHENDIARAKLMKLQLIGEVLGPNGSVNVTLEEEEAASFVAGLNDLRLFLAASEMPPGEGPMADRDALVEWLAYNQDSLLTAMMD